MNIKDLLKERDNINQDISRKKLNLELVEDKIISIAKEDIRKLHNIYGSVLKTEKEFKAYASNFIEIDKVEYIDQAYMKWKEFKFTYNNIEWTIVIPYSLIDDVITYEITQGTHDKIKLCRKIKKHTTTVELYSDDMDKCFKYVKSFKEIENEGRE